MRESQTERTPPTLASHILVRRVLGGYPQQRPITVEVWGASSRPPFMRCCVCLGRFRDATGIAVDYSFARKEKAVNDADMKVEVNTSLSNANGHANEKRGFDMPLFDLPKMAIPGVFRGIAEQSVVRVRENCEKMKAASGEMADVLRETYSTNAKGAADYGVKVIEISSVNTTSAFEFFNNLMGTKSLS